MEPGRHVSLKAGVAKAVDRALGTESWFRIFRAIDRRFRPDAVYAVNYHATYPRDEANFKRHLDFLAEYFEFVQLGDLLESRAPGPSGRPRLLLTFDDGTVSNYEVAAPLLEERGARGVFFVPTRFLDDPGYPSSIEKDELEALERQRLDEFHLRYVDARRELGLGKRRVSMTWDEVSDLLSRGHEVGTHGRYHLRLASSLDKEQVYEEVRGSLEDYRSQLGVDPCGFCWIGGDTWAYSDFASREIRAAEYRASFLTCCAPFRPERASPHLIHRFNLESDMPVERLRTVLSGFYELKYAHKRRTVEKEISANV